MSNATNPAPAARIVDRVRKLLALAKSSNVGEASNAAAAAQKLMSAHAIDAALLDVATDATADEPVEHDTMHAHGKEGSNMVPGWVGQLGVAIAQVNGCHCFKDGRTLGIIGRASDATAARYLLAYVIREIERLAVEAADERGRPGRTWSNQFRMGAAVEVGRRLLAAHKAAKADARREADAGDTLGTGAALARVDSALALLDARHDAAVAYGRKKLKLRAGPARRVNAHAGARAAGKRAGAGINLGGARAGLASGTRAALGQ